MNEVVNNFLWAGDKFITQIHLRQLRFTYRACGLFTKNKERILKFKETGDSKYIYQNELNKASIQYDMACGKLKYLPKRTIECKMLRDKAFNVDQN